MGVRGVVVLSSLFMLGALAVPASAQGTSWGDVAVSGVVIDYDLSGTGQTAGVAVRLTRELTDRLALEARGLYARPDQQVGPSTLFIPEAQLQYRWQVARVSPFVGGGIGAAGVWSDIGTDWDPTLSIGGGASVRLSDRVSVVGEMRLRGVEWRFAGSTAEWSGGLAWRLPGL